MSSAAPCSSVRLTPIQSNTLEYQIKYQWNGMETPHEEPSPFPQPLPLESTVETLLHT